MQRKPGYARARKGGEGFYADLPAFSDFLDLTKPGTFAAAPADWLVVITDIEGSTEAIGRGRYKDVNMVGGACITAVLNAVEAVDIPFVFGGDGATLLTPPASEVAVRGALIGLARFAQEFFDLDLRAGLVPVAEVERRGRPVLVARFELSPGNHMALFGGGGVDLAESLVKDAKDDDPYCIRPGKGEAGEVDLSGLSCRWEPLRARGGVMLSILVQAPAASPDGADAVYGIVLKELSAIIGGAVDAGNPVADETLRFRWPPRGLEMEARALVPGGLLWPMRMKLLLESFLQGLANRFDLKIGPMDAKKYRGELRLNADFRRFDDTLRMVVDCTPDQAKAIEACLAELRGGEGIAYGVHRSDSALMTCLVFSLEDSDHLHFIDGSDGGFALAARQLKAQLAER